MSALRAVAAAGLSLAASVALSACCGGGAVTPEPPARARWFFETPCTGGPSCDFAAERGSAVVTQLFHPGERGLTLGPAAVAAASLDWGDPMGSYPVSIRLVARCDAGTSLAAHFEVGAAPALLMGTHDATARAALDTYTEWSRVSVTFSAWFSGRAVRLRLVTSGPGSCQVDSVELFDRPMVVPVC